MQRYEELVSRWRALSGFVYLCQILSDIVGNGAKYVRKFLAQFMFFLYLCIEINEDDDDDDDDNVDDDEDDKS